MIEKLKKWISYACQPVWTVGFVDVGIDELLTGKSYTVRWVDVPSEGWYADPFILHVSEKVIVLLVEEWDDGRKKGSITKITIDRKSNSIVEKKVILQLKTHLSFPVIYRVDGKIYITPENSESGCLNVYQYDESSDTAFKIKCICQQPVADAVATEILGEKLLFATLPPNPNGKELDVFRWNSEKEEFESSSQVFFKENIARMAGHFFEYQGDLYRPAQVCNTAYGQAVSIQKVVKKGDQIDMYEVRRLFSTHPRWNMGMHTFNSYQGEIVVDAWGWRKPLLRRLFVDDWGNVRRWLR